MDQALAVFLLLSLGVAAQTETTTVYVHNTYTEVSVPQSQLETTEIVSRPVQLSSDIQVTITAQKNVTRCEQLSISPCPDPELLVAVLADTDNNKTYTYSKTVTGGLRLVIAIDSTVTFTPQDVNADAGQAIVYLIYKYAGNLRSLNTDGNSSVVTVRLSNAFTMPDGGQNGGSSGPENGQPPLYRRGLFGIMATMLVSAFLLS